MKINEVDDIKIDEDGNTYRQSVLNEMEEAYNTNWDEVEGIELTEEYFAKVKAGTVNPWD